jgi:hypothetical protein
MDHLRVRKGFSEILTLFFVVLLSLLSGCVTSEEPNKFDTSTAFFSDPLTNTMDTIHFRKLNHSEYPYILFDQDSYEILIKVHDTQGMPGNNLSLNLYFQTIEGWYMSKREMLINESSWQLVTNTSGIATIVLIYNQSWSLVCGKGYFGVTSSHLINRTGNSRYIQFNFFNKRISRNTNAFQGLTMIDQVENTSLIEESIRQQPDNNDFLFWQQNPVKGLDNIMINGTTIKGLTTVIINGTTLSKLIQQTSGVHNYYLSFTYLAWALKLPSDNVLYSAVTAAWNNYVKESLSGITNRFDSSGRISSGSFPNNTITEGWLILQVVGYSRQSGPLNGERIYTWQLVLLDGTGQLRWLVSWGTQYYS